MRDRSRMLLFLTVVFLLLWQPIDVINKMPNVEAVSSQTTSQSESLDPNTHPTQQAIERVLSSKELKDHPSRERLTSSRSVEQFQFFAKIEASNENLATEMILNGTVLTFKSAMSIYVYQLDVLSSNIMEFRYYKTCINDVPPRVLNRADGGITLKIFDPTDAAITYSFHMKRSELPFEQKIEMMFHEMRTEIKSLKDKMWCKYDIEIGQLF